MGRTNRWLPGNQLRAKMSGAKHKLSRYRTFDHPHRLHSIVNTHLMELGNPDTID
jgi:hypothetical protein